MSAPSPLTPELAYCLPNSASVKPVGLQLTDGRIWVMLYTATRSRRDGQSVAPAFDFIGHREIAGSLGKTSGTELRL